MIGHSGTKGKLTGWSEITEEVAIIVFSQARESSAGRLRYACRAADHKRALPLPEKPSKTRPGFSGRQGELLTIPHACHPPRMPAARGCCQGYTAPAAALQAPAQLERPSISCSSQQGMHGLWNFDSTASCQTRQASTEYESVRVLVLCFMAFTTGPNYHGRNMSVGRSACPL